MIQTEGSSKKILGGKVGKMKNENDLIDKTNSDMSDSVSSSVSDDIILSDKDIKLLEQVEHPKLDITLQEILKNKRIPIQHIEHANKDNLEHTRSDHARSYNANKDNLEHTRSDHARSDHTRSEHTRSDHARSEHTRSDHARSEHARSEHTRSDHARSEHVNYLTKSDLADFRIVKLDGKKSDYFSRKYEFKYVTHWGQLKLLLSEIEFLTIAMKTLDPNKKFIFIYAGAATGDHIPYLSDLFPSVEFLLYDPADFNIRESERIKIINDYFFDSTAAELAIKYKDHNILFCSDIRTEDTSDQNNIVSTTDADIVENMKMQFNWYRIINPDLSMFKFRLPFEDGNSIYPEGTIYTQAFCGPTSTETRLIVRKNANDISYNNKDYEQLLFYHNTVIRKNEYDLIGKLNFKQDGLCNCYDCTSFIVIVNSYMELTEKMSNDIRENREIILEKIKEVIINTNKKTKRTLYDQTKKQFAKQWGYLIAHYLNKQKNKKHTQGYRANTKSFKTRNK
jgi:hypothetical protein